jgi:hypothetical protein
MPIPAPTAAMPAPKPAPNFANGAKLVATSNKIDNKCILSGIKLKLKMKN